MIFLVCSFRLLLEYRECDFALASDAADRLEENRFELQKPIKQLKKCHECGHSRRFDLMHEVQRDLALWHYVRQHLHERNYPVDAADFWVMHDDGLTDLVMDIAFETSTYVLDGGVQEVR